MTSHRPTTLLLILGVGLLLGLGSGCSGGEESDTPVEGRSPSSDATRSGSGGSPASAPAEPLFDRGLLIGTWTSSLVDIDNDMRQDLVVTYQDDRFVIIGDFSSSDPKKLEGLLPRMRRQHRRTQQKQHTSPDAPATQPRSGGNGEE